MMNVKLVQVGDGAVGKTCLLIAYANGSFPDDYIPTVFDNYNANVVVDDRAVNLGLWDIGGGEVRTSFVTDRLRPLSYPETDVFLLSFSLVDPTSLENITSKWHPEVRTHCPDARLILVGTKLDLRDDPLIVDQLRERDEFPVNTEQGETVARTIGAASYIECSAKTLMNVRQVFEAAVRSVFAPSPAELRASAEAQATDIAARRSRFGSQQLELMRTSRLTIPEAPVTSISTEVVSDQDVSLAAFRSSGIKLMTIPSQSMISTKNKSVRLSLMLVLSARDTLIDPPRRSPINLVLCFALPLEPDSGTPSSTSTSTSIRLACRKALKRLRRGDTFSVVLVRSHGEVEALMRCEMVMAEGDVELVSRVTASLEGIERMEMEMSSSRRTGRSIQMGSLVQGLSESVECVKEVSNVNEEVDFDYDDPDDELFEARRRRSKLQVDPSKLNRIILITNSMIISGNENESQSQSESETEETNSLDSILSFCHLHHISISTIGIGSQYDPSLLSSIPRSSHPGGSFYHSHSPRTLGMSLSKELHGCTTLLRAHSCKISLLPLGGLDILQVRGCESSIDPLLRTIEGRSAEGSRAIDVGDLRYGDLRKIFVMAKLRPPKAKGRSLLETLKLEQMLEEDETMPEFDYGALDVCEVQISFYSHDDRTLIKSNGRLSLQRSEDLSRVKSSLQLPAIFQSALSLSQYSDHFRSTGQKVATKSFLWRRKLNGLKQSFKKHMGKDICGHLQQMIRRFFSIVEELDLSSSSSSNASVGRALSALGFDVDSSSDFAYSQAQDSDSEWWEEEEEGEEREMEEEEGEGVIEMVDEVEEEIIIEDVDEIMDDDGFDFDDDDDEDDEMLVLNEDDEFDEDEDDDDDFDDFDFDDDEEGEGEVELDEDGEESSGGMVLDDRFAGLLSPTSPLHSNPFEVVDPASLVVSQQHKILGVADALHCTVGIAGALLKHFRWNQTGLCAAYIENPEQVCEDARVTLSTTPYTTGVDLEQEGELTCAVCFMDCDPSEMFALACGHYFCRDCWQHYLHVKIGDGPRCLMTLCQYQGCGKVVDEELFRVICPEADLELYERYLLRSLVEDNPKIKWCPKADCGSAVYCPDTTVENVMCKCGESFCFQCQTEAHQPATCDEIEMWRDKADTNSSVKQWLAANTKRCPLCRKRIEKNGGCNHMTCSQCGYEWCWMCGAIWLTHGDWTGGYYKCIFVSEEKAQRRMERKARRMESKKQTVFKEYLQQYTAHNVSQDFERQLNLRISSMEEHLPPAERGYLPQAARDLIECRRSLKYTFVKLYFMRDAPRRELDLFEHMQGGLFAQTEMLAELLESSTYRRDEIVPCAKAARTRLQHLLDGVKHGLVAQ